MTMMDRLWSRVDASGDCWVWTGARSNGYGVIGRGRRGEGNVQVHRAVWENIVGPVPPGLELDHLCRNRACCNPDHLQPVTRKINIERGAHATGWARRSRTHCKHGHEYTPANTKQTPRQRKCRECIRIQSRQKRARDKVAS